MISTRCSRAYIAAALFASISVTTLRSFAGDIEFQGVQPAAIDQPQINAIIYLGNNLVPQTAMVDLFDWDTFTSSTGNVFNITAYFDTGASGILLSTPTATALNIPAGPGIYFDTGAVGADSFQVSTDVRVSIANFIYTRTDLDQFTGSTPITTPYTPILNPLPPPLVTDAVRLQMGPYHPNTQDPLIGDLGDIFGNDPDFAAIGQLIAQLNAVDVIGMPAMKGNVVVIDPSRVNHFDDFFDSILTAEELPDVFLHTYVYQPGTAFKPLTVDTDPGIPSTSHHIKLSYGTFDRFTLTTPAGAPTPTLIHNPFIGTAPAQAPEDVSNTPVPGITITRAEGNTTHTSTGSWLLDTGAAASMISSAQAEKLHVQYLTPPTSDDPNPVLVDDNGDPIDNQFKLTIGGIGGEITLAGFFLDTLTLHTMEGDDIRFRDAPVLVHDIKLTNPNDADDFIILDGIFGMNFLVASSPIDALDALGGLAITPGAFKWITFDEPNGILGLDIDTSLVPEPASLTMLAAGGLLMLRRRRSARQ